MITVTIHTKQGSTELQCQSQAEVDEARRTLTAEARRRGMTALFTIKSEDR